LPIERERHLLHDLPQWHVAKQGQTDHLRAALFFDGLEMTVEPASIPTFALRKYSEYSYHWLKVF
jgi:hypothetical protein